MFVGVLVDDDPGRDLGERGHRFFFAPDGGRSPPARCWSPGSATCSSATTGSACALGGRRRRPPTGVEVVDFGIRGMDLAYALGATTTSVVFLDATPRGGAPGTLYVIEPDLDGLPLDVDAHGMDPVKVLALARALGARCRARSCSAASRVAREEECRRAQRAGAGGARTRPRSCSRKSLRKELMKNAIIVIGAWSRAGGAVGGRDAARSSGGT